MKEAMQTLCAFLNGMGGTVLLGIKPNGTIEGQDVSDQTLRDIAQAADRFEPPAHAFIHCVKVKATRDVIVIVVEGGREMRPFVYEGHAYERVSSTTRRMPQPKYERLLIVTFRAQMVPGIGDGAEQPDRPKTPEKTPEKVVSALRENPTMSLAEVADSIGTSRSAVERACVKLAKSGRLRRIGPDKGGHWEVTAKDEG